MQEDNLVYILIFLIAQTITLYKKLTAIEVKLKQIIEDSKRHEDEINKIKKVIIDKIENSYKELIP